MTRRSGPVAIATVSVVAYVIALSDLLGPRYRLDFRIYYGAVSSARAGQSLYDFHFRLLGLGFTYPPFAALALKPLTLLSFDDADAVWLVASALASAAFLVLAIRHTSLAQKSLLVRSVIVAVCMWSMPVFVTGRLGQINAFIALAVLVDLLAALDGRRAYAGVGVGVAAALKLTPLVALVALVALRRYRAAALTVLGFAGGATVAAIAYPHDTARYWTSILFETKRVGPVGSAWNNSIRALIADLSLPGALPTVVWLAASLALVVVAYRRVRDAHAAGNPLAAVTLVMCCGAAIAPISWSHHLYFLVPAFLLVLGDVTDRRRVLTALAMVPLVFEVVDPGKVELLVRARGLLLPALVLWLPIDVMRSGAAPRAGAPADGPVPAPAHRLA